jgi:starch synthase
MASAEAAPLVKVGGLGDVVGSLPPALQKLGCDVRLILPMYGVIDRKKYKIKKIIPNFKIPSGKRQVKINIWQTALPHSSVKIYLIEEKKYFGPKIVYSKKNNSERFLFFSLASLNILEKINFQPDIIHCHDFHTALIADLLKANDWPFLKNTKTIFTIHNLNYQGKSDIEVLKTGNLKKNSLKSLSRDARDGDINFMVQGILNADLVSTVSKTYAKEITTSFFGAKLDNIIKKRKKDLSGILNGIDTEFFNPATDKFIKQKYSLKNLDKKIKNKLALQKKLGLPQDKNIALAGLISRLVWQKGLELFTKKFSQLNCQFVFLGTGSKKYEALLKKLAKEYPDKFKAIIGFDEELAHQIYAGADLFLMPSRFEPCGLGQMIAMRYGTVPVVRQTGGLADTVTPLTKINSPSLRRRGLGEVKKSTGFAFKNFNSNALYNKLNKALSIYYNKPKIWRQLQINGMKKDFSWDKSAKEYLKLYKKLV